MQLAVSPGCLIFIFLLKMQWSHVSIHSFPLPHLQPLHCLRCPVISSLAMKKINKGTDTEGWVGGDFSDFFSCVWTSGGSEGAVVVMREGRGFVCLGISQGPVWLE